MREFAVIGVGLYTPGFAGVEAWRGGVADEASARPTGVSLERRSRRLASDLMRGLADAYQEAAQQGGVDLQAVASVFGSSLGEASTMIGLLDQMWALKEEPSPMAFATSVHNAAAGVVSISNKNQAFTTSIAADYDTVAMTLLEAVGLLATGASEVVIACGDEAAPEKLVREEFHWGFLCGALALSSDVEHPNCLGVLRVPTMNVPSTVDTERATERLRGNPQFGLLKLIDAIVERRFGVLALDEGRGRGWSVELREP